MINNGKRDLNILLDYLEENIDLEHAQKVEKLHLDTIVYRGVPYLPISIIFPLDERFVPFPYKEAFEDPEKMLFNELLWSFSSIYNSVKLKDHFPLHIRANLGVGVLASLFGAKCKVIYDSMPWIEPINDIDKIRKIIDKGIPEFSNGLGERVCNTYRYFNDRLKEYDKCYKVIKISQPDLQGPFDIAHLLMGSDIFYGVYDYPDLIHELLELITETYIKFKKHISPLLTDSAGQDAVYVHGCIYGGNVLIKDDTATINLSHEMYEEFSGQYNRKIYEAFDGGSIHYCGPFREWHMVGLNSKGLKGVNYGNPELHQLDRNYQYWREQKVPMLWWGYNQGIDFIEEVYKLGVKTGISLAVKAESFMEAKEILKTHVERG